jgi:hypothetical protein
MDTIASLAPIRQLIAQSTARYASITPKGILLPAAPVAYNPLPATIITYKPARTRYLLRKPVCRSLNGISSVDQKQSCSMCQEARTCTPQIALDFNYRVVPFRLLLAFTSANNFITFLRRFGAAGISCEGVPISITVIDHGRWGEARFDNA